jgi:branched-chain amino acid transport system substrate-binding protein
MNIGVLYPRSNAYPGCSMDFMNGIKTALKEKGIINNVHFFSESAGFGGSEKEVYEKLEKLLMIEGADMVVAFIDEKVQDILHPLIQASGKLVIVVNPGANYPGTWVPQPSIIHLTLNHAFLCWLTGSMAARQKDAMAAIATSFYDCGYLHLARMTEGFCGSERMVAYNYINQQRYDESFHINELTEFLEKNPGIINLLCLFDSLPASLFYNRLNDWKNAGDVELFVSPMMLEGKALLNREEGYRFSVDGYMPWNAAVDIPGNKEFIQSYFSHNNREPDLFALLGWETGLIIEQLFISGTGTSNGPGLVDLLMPKKISGPRGALVLDPETNFYLAPLCRFSLKRNTAKPDISVEETVQTRWMEYIQRPTDGAASGWTNTYLCY